MHGGREVIALASRHCGEGGGGVLEVYTPPKDSKVPFFLVNLV
jgi:hypothetical protein